MTLHYVYPVLEVIEAIDGDNVRVKVPLMETPGHRVINLRLAGVNAPESRTRKDMMERKAGKLVHEVVQFWVDENPSISFHMTSDARPKYHGRMIGRLVFGWPTHNEYEDDTLNHRLLFHKLVRPYEGGARVSWGHEELTGIIARAEAILRT